MSTTVTSYVAKFREHLESKRAFAALLTQCEGDLLLAARNVTEGEDFSVDEAEVKVLFLKFLDDGNFAPLMELHQPEFDKLHAIGTAKAEEVLAAARKLLESEYAIWHAHKLLLDGIRFNADAKVLINDLCGDETFQELLRQPDGFALHETLAFAEI